MFLLIIWLIFCIGVAALAQRMGRSSAAYFLIALLLSPLVGLVVLLIVGDNKKAVAPRISPTPTVRCPHCFEVVRAGSRVCPSCARDLFDQVSAAPSRKRPKGFYYQSNGQVEGPFTREDLETFYEAGTIEEHTQVCQEGDDVWQFYSSLREKI